MKNTVKSEFYYMSQKILFFLALIETTFYLAASFACGRGGWRNSEGGGD
jgi:hypothetical protein